MRLIVILVVVAFAIGCTPPPTDQEIRDARSRIGGLAFCLEHVAEDIGTGTFETKYAGCVDSFLGNGGFDVLRAGGGSGLVLDVRDLLNEREVGFQKQIDRAKAATDIDLQRSALMSYQLLLGAAAEDLRKLRAESIGEN